MTEHTPDTASVPRNAQAWAPNVARLEVNADRAKAGYNIQGRRITGPQQGFGRLWQRTYTTDLGSVVTAQQLVADWKLKFGSYWPKGATFYAGLTGVNPGDVAPIGISTGPGMTLATGILVLYADDDEFTFMTPEGHMFAGMITFAAVEDEGRTIAKIRILIRTNDPLYELGWPVMKRKEDTFWSTTLENLATDHGLPACVVTQETVCVDRKRLWRNWTNIRHNAGIRSFLHMLRHPFGIGSRG
jgi:hypothetical protein